MDSEKNSILMATYYIFEGEYKNGLKWNGKGYDGKNNVVYELNDGKGYVKEYDMNILVFEGQYVNGQKMEKVKNTIFLVIYNLKENI